MKHKRSVRWNVARHMPPLRHSEGNGEYDVERSEVARWLCSQPDIMQIVFDSVKTREIIYDSTTREWRGVDYEH